VFHSSDAIAERLGAEAKPGDLLLIMSNAALMLVRKTSEELGTVVQLAARRKPVILTLVGVSANFGAPLHPVSSPIWLLQQRAIRYEVSLAHPEQHLFHVTMTIPNVVKKSRADGGMERPLSDSRLQQSRPECYGSCRYRNIVH